MSSYRQVYYQIVLGAKHRLPTIPESHSTELYRYISGVIRNKNCKLHCINGVEDHIHIFSDLHPTICLADYVKDVKVASSLWMKANGNFPKFEAWQEGYGAFNYSGRERDKIINYIKNQKEHHKKQTFREEFRGLLIENAIEFEEKYLL